MGSVLVLSGAVYLDTNCVIYSVERVEPYHSLLQPYWQAARQGSCKIVTSALTLMEALIKPIHEGNATLEQGFRALLLHSLDTILLPIDQHVLERAAQIRATTSLKTPDAIHAATALEVKCTLFVTNDAAFQRIPELTVHLLAPPAP